MYCSGLSAMYTAPDDKRRGRYVILRQIQEALRLAYLTFTSGYWIKIAKNEL